MPQLLEAGKVYKAIPPLYSMNKNNKTSYFTDKVEFVKYVQRTFISQNQVVNPETKQPMNSKEMTLFFMNNEDYVYELESISQTYAVDPKLMEIALFAHINNKKVNDVSKRLKNEFRFMNVTQDKKGNFLYEGTIRESNFLYTDQKLLNDCEKIIKIMKKNRLLYYKLNGQEASIYDIMKAFEQCTPPKLQRYKGLGEMDGDELAVSTLLPDSDRMLIRYTLEEAKEELSIIREYESDRSKLLDLVGTVKRIDLED
jgi:DNA gyrase/topoisomerase IV subunit B